MGRRSIALTVHSTAAEVTAAGGEGIAVRCDHGDDSQVAALFDQIQQESGRLDILVNNATMIHPELISPAVLGEGACGCWHFGRRSEIGVCRELVCGENNGAAGSGLIAFGSSFGANCYMHGPGYGAQKAGIDKFAHDMQHDFADTGVNAVSIWMGPLKTERALMAAEVHPRAIRRDYEGG